MHLLLPAFNLSYEFVALYPLTFFEIMKIRETHKISARVFPWTDVAPVYSAIIGYSAVGIHE